MEPCTRHAARGAALDVILAQALGAAAAVAPS
jgi:hypothetical protein